jgi:hypothetical protein
MWRWAIIVCIAAGRDKTSFLSRRDGFRKLLKKSQIIVEKKIKHYKNCQIHEHQGGIVHLQ